MPPSAEGLIWVERPPPSGIEYDPRLFAAMAPAPIPATRIVLPVLVDKPTALVAKAELAEDTGHGVRL